MCRARPIVVLILLGVCLASPALAGICTVPGSHATIQAAINDPACAQIELAAQTYPESIEIPRTLTISGPAGGGAIIEGRVWVVGAGTVVDPSDLAIQNGCLESAMRVQGGAQVSGTNLEVERSAALPCPPLIIFADGFESGGTGAWTMTVP